MKVNPKKPLYIITDGGILRRKENLVASIREALEGAGGGVGFVQLREQVVGPQAGPFPRATDDEIIKLIADIRPICREFDAKIMVNGRADLAQAGGADGVHLNVYSSGVADTRKAAGDDFIVGFSAHSIEEVRQASTEGADYLLCSPVFAPMSHKSPRPPIGIDGLQKLIASASIPVFALGGITAENAAACRSAGAAGIAVITAVLRAGGADSAAGQLIDAWEGAA